jgi:hypothetical protein
MQPSLIITLDDVIALNPKSSVDRTHSKKSASFRDAPAVLLGFSSEPVVNLSSSDASSVYSDCSAVLQVDRTGSICATALIEFLESGGESGLIDTAMLDLLLDTLKGSPDLVLGCNVSPHTEPHRLCRRPFGLSYAANAGASSMA